MHPHARPTRAPAFSLMEVLIAMSIFTIGAVAVAAIFPVGVLLQRETVNASLSAHVSESATAMIDAKGFRFNPAWGDTGPNAIPGNGLAGAAGTDAEVRTFPVPDTDATAPMAQVGYGLLGWLLADRGYPSLEPDAASRQFYWVPLVYDLDDDPTTAGSNRTWMLFVFVLRREDNVQYGPIGVNPGLGKTYPSPTVDGEGQTTAAAQEFQAASIPGVAWIGVNNGATSSYHVTGLSSAVALGDDEFEFNNNAPGGGLRVNVSDPILDQFGSIYRVIAADSDSIQVDRNIVPKPRTTRMPDGFWYAPGSTAKRIEVLIDSSANNVVWE